MSIQKSYSTVVVAAVLLCLIGRVFCQNIRIGAGPANTGSSTTYRGGMYMMLNSNNRNIQYHISFSRYADGCNHTYCYYGWVDNYTVDGVFFEGYPKSPAEVKPVF